MSGGSFSGAVILFLFTYLFCAYAYPKSMNIHYIIFCILSFHRYTATLYHNTYNNFIKDNSVSEKEVALFKLNIEDIMENPHLKVAIVSFHCLNIQEEIGHGRYFSNKLFSFFLSFFQDNLL